MPTIAFSQPFPDLTDAKPKALRLGAASYETPVWSKVLEVTARALLESYHYHQAVLSAVKLFSWFGHINYGMTRPCELDKGLWIELNQGSKGIIVRTRKLLEACGYPLEKAALVYEASQVATAAPPSSLKEESQAKPAKVATSDSITPPPSVPKLSEEAFVRYVADTSTDNNAKKCRTGIRKISRILADMGLVKSNIFEIVALEQLQSATTTLRENAEYLAEDKRSNGWLRSPLNHYLCFAETVLCNSSHPVLPFPSTNPAKSKSLAQVQPSLPEIPPSGKHAKKKAEKEPYTAYPKRELFAALAEDRIPDEDFDKLLTLEGTRDILGMTPRHDTPVFSLMHQRFFWHDPTTRRGKPVYVTAQWFERDKARLDKLLSRWRETLHDTSTTPDMKRFLDDIREHWPEGFDFSDGAVRLLEGRCGSLPPGMERQLKAAMFRLRGGIWLVPDSVAPKEAIDTVLREADRSISDAGFVSIAFLAKSNELERSRLSAEKDRCAFIEHVLSSSGFTIAEHNGFMFATKGGSPNDGYFRNWCTLVRKAVEASGALPFAQLMQDPAFGNIDEDAAFALLREYEPTVIPEHDPDGGLQFKMLSEYYLPEDMETALREIVVAADNGGAITAAALCSALSQRYDCDFAQDYALDPAYSFKWVVDAVWRVNAKAEPRYWDGVGARARFVSVGYGNTESGRQEAGGPRPQGDRPADLPSQVEVAFTGVFSNEDFWHYSTETYGLASSREAKIAQLGYLAPRFIRLDRDRWMSLADFRNAASWNETKANAMAEVLRNALGSASILPMATLGLTTLDALPAIPYRWTPELAASVAALLCPGCHVANHGTSPFAVTALLVPRPIAPDEVIRYTVGIYAARNPHARSVEGAFEFLKANNIRFRLTRNCREEIETCLAKETL